MAKYLVNLSDYMTGLVSNDSDDFDGYLLSEDDPEQLEDGNNYHNVLCYHYNIITKGAGSSMLAQLLHRYWRW